MYGMHPQQEINKKLSKQGNLTRAWLTKGYQSFRRVGPRQRRQLRVWAAKIRGGGILADIQNSAADGPGAGEMIEQGFSVPAPDGPGQLGQILVEGSEHFQHGIFVAQEHVTPHGRVRRRDAGEVAEP